MAWDRYEFTIGKHFLSALIDGDVTALENDDIQKLKTFEHKAGLLLEKHEPISHHWTVDVADCTHFAKCEVTGLYADVSDVALEFQFKE